MSRPAGIKPNVNTGGLVLSNTGVRLLNVGCQASSAMLNSDTSMSLAKHGSTNDLQRRIEEVATIWRRLGSGINPESRLDRSAANWNRWLDVVVQEDSNRASASFIVCSGF